jgi:glycosyltransferase involved in cell wall biosynthesis
MNILFLADNFPPERNAQASRVYERACYWVRWGHKVTVVTCFPNFPEGKIYPGFGGRAYSVSEMDGIRVVRVPTFTSPNSGVALRTLDFLSYMVTGFLGGLAEERPDVVVATSPQFFAAVAGAALATVKQVPFVMEVSDLWPDSIVAVGAMKPGLAMRALTKVEMALYHKAARVVLLTDAFRRVLTMRGVPAEKLDVVRNGVDLARFAPLARDTAYQAECGIRDGEFVVGYIGTHGLAHALDNVLDAAELLRSQPVRFLFVGAGAARDALVAEAARRGLDNVTFMPAVGKDRVTAAWSVCDAGLVHLKDTPLFRTVIPSKIFEAMGMGLPVILAAPDGEATDVLRLAGAGIAVPAQHPEALARAVSNLANDPPRTSALAQASLAAASRHSREVQAQKMLAALQRAVGPLVPEYSPVEPVSIG